MFAIHSVHNNGVIVTICSTLIVMRSMLWFQIIHNFILHKIHVSQLIHYKNRLSNLGANSILHLSSRWDRPSFSNTNRNVTTIYRIITARLYSDFPLADYSSEYRDRYKAFTDDRNSSLGMHHFIWFCINNYKRANVLYYATFAFISVYWFWTIGFIGNVLWGSNFSWL